jgi:hypothetical protein
LDISMNAIYGEGRYKAFQRLMREVKIQIGDDQAQATTSQPTDPNPSRTSSMLVPGSNTITGTVINQPLVLPRAPPNYQRLPGNDFETSREDGFLTSELSMELRSLTYDHSTLPNVVDPFEWVNLGDGSPEVDDEIEGCFGRPYAIDLTITGEHTHPWQWLFSFGS